MRCPCISLAKRRWEHSRAALQEAQATELRATHAAESRRRWLERGAEAAEKHSAVVDEPGNYLGVAPAVVIQVPTTVPGSHTDSYYQSYIYVRYDTLS